MLRLDQNLEQVLLFCNLLRTFFSNIVLPVMRKCKSISVHEVCEYSEEPVVAVFTELFSFVKVIYHKMSLDILHQQCRNCKL